MTGHVNLSAISGELSALVERISSDICLIESPGAHTRTGIIYDASHAVTVAHAAEEGDRVTLLTKDGEQSATVTAYDAATEIALVRVEGKLREPEWRLPEKDVNVGQLMVSVAYPSREGPEARLEMVRCVGRGNTAGGPVTYIQGDARRFPGFAGGPAVTPAGELLGQTALVTGGRDEFIVPGAMVLETAKRLGEHGSTRHGYLGVRTQEVRLTEKLEKALGRTQERGLLVVVVDEGSPADRAEVLPGDIVTGLGGETIVDHETLLSALHAAGAWEGAGDAPEVKLEVLRGGERHEFIVGLDARTESVSYRMASARRGPWRFHGRGHGRHCR